MPLLSSSQLQVERELIETIEDREYIFLVVFSYSQQNI